MQKPLLAIAVVAALGLVGTAAKAATLDSVMAKGFLQCGVTSGVPGMSQPDANNNWSGLEVDFCRAVAAAIFDDPDKVRYTPLTSQERFVALSAGEVDILSRVTTWTMSRDTDMGISFTGVLYYDGQGFLVRENDGIASALELDGKTVCMEADTTTELNVAEYFAANGMEFTPVTFVDKPEVLKAYEDGRCDVLTSDGSQLAADRTKFANPSDHVLLPETISKEPLGPSVRQGDQQWFNINRWVYFALLEAEELGVTQANIDEMLGSDNPAVKRLLGVEGDFGTPIGLPVDWGYRVIKHIGNYGESFDRNLGEGSPIGLPRGLNALWNKGGLQYAPPIR